MSKVVAKRDPAQLHPPVAGDVYSLKRWARQIELGNKMPTQFRVGGRYHSDLGQFSLVDSGGSLRLGEPIAEARHGDLLILELNSLGLKVQTTSHHQIDATFSGPIAKFEIVGRQQSSQPLVQSNALVSQQWADFLRVVRSTMGELGLGEVQTPTLVQNPGMEPELEPFSVVFKNGQSKHSLFLATSPELHLKQLLCGGFTDIFEIKTVYRNEEITSMHEPEFLMLEWYRAYAHLGVIQSDLLELIAKLTKAHTGFASTVSRFTVAEVFALHTGFALEPNTQREELFELALSRELNPGSDFDFNDLFHLIWVALVEPRLPKEPFLLRDYPPSQAALARIGANGWADRFEFYWRGFEIANAFHELNDPREQRARFERDQKKRQEYRRTSLTIDENFMTALEYGLPPSGGIALGLDRLFMALHGYENIQATRQFGIAHNVKLGRR